MVSTTVIVKFVAYAGTTIFKKPRLLQKLKIRSLPHVELTVVSIVHISPTSQWACSFKKRKSRGTNTGAHFVSVLVNSHGIATSTKSSQTLAHVKFSDVGWKVGTSDGAREFVGWRVGFRDSVGLIDIVGEATGTEVGRGDGMKVPWVQVSSVGMEVGKREGYGVGRYVSDGADDGV